LLIALGIIILFAFLGNSLMDFLNVGPGTTQIAGGIILFLLCLKMIFPRPSRNDELDNEDKREPLIVPLAIPLVAGPGVLAAVMIFARQETSDLIMISAIFIAWLASLLILLCSSFIKQIFGERGIIAIERLMGLILTLIAVEMFLSGVSVFLQNQ
jgi:multiple antibiotic resistance protein